MQTSDTNQCVSIISAHHGMVWYGMYDTPRRDGQSSLNPAYFMSTLPISPPRSRPLARCELIYIRNQVCFHRLGSVSVQTAQARRSKLANTRTFPGSGAKLDLQLPNLHKWAVSFASPWLSLMIFLMEHSVIRRTRFQFHRLTGRMEKWTTK